MLNILIRSDSSNLIGMGHIARDLVLAEILKSNGHQVNFCCLPLEGNAIPKIEKKGFGVEVLNSESEEELIKLITQKNIDLIIIDHYKINKETEEEIKRQTDVMVFVIDDLYKDHCCDILLNHNISGDENRYMGKVPKDCLVMAGPQFSLIRNEFRELNVPDRELPNDRKIAAFISFGGTDPTNLSEKAVECLKGFDQIQLNVFTTSSNPSLSHLTDKIKNIENAALYVDEPNLAEKMNGSDFAVVSPSMTCAEAILLELPLIAIKAIDNQQNTFNFLIKNNIIALEPEEIKELSQCVDKILNPVFYQDYFNHIKSIKQTKFKPHNRNLYELIITKTNR